MFGKFMLVINLETRQIQFDNWNNFFKLYVLPDLPVSLIANLQQKQQTVTLLRVVKKHISITSAVLKDITNTSRLFS